MVREREFFFKRWKREGGREEGKSAFFFLSFLSLSRASGSLRERLSPCFSRDESERKLKAKREENTHERNPKIFKKIKNFPHPPKSASRTRAPPAT